MYFEPLNIRRFRKDLSDTPFTYNVQDKLVTANIDGKEHKFKIEHYPFSPPIIWINDKRLSYSSMCYPPRLWKTYNETYNKFKGCICCNNKLCENNWSPVFRITDLLNEYRDFENTLKLIAKILVFKHSSLPDDMIFEIESFLLVKY
uniref:Uncharacterized protein n=1 Tax=viral metagenome TaxID=1070528 RepID=A0A6C0LK22_9ZZZZ